jgi:Tol biopolymer transport system component
MWLAGMVVKAVLYVGGMNTMLAIIALLSGVTPPMYSAQVSFVARTPDGWDIYLHDVTAGIHTNLTRSGTVDIHSPPAWSPDGTQIAFVAGADLYVINPRDATSRRLTHNADLTGFVTWSPDGARIAFIAQQSLERNIHIVDTDGHSARLIGDNALVSFAPAWSPQGERIAFITPRDGVWIADLDEQALHPVVDNPALFEQSGIVGNIPFSQPPVWSPDGERLAVVAPSMRHEFIYALAADGSDIIPLTHSPGRRGPDRRPAWSPDGRYLACVTGRFSRQQVYVLALDDPPHSAQQVAIGTSPAWSPDGAHLVLLAGVDGERDVHIVNLASGFVRQITHRRDDVRHPAWRP